MQRFTPLVINAARPCRHAPGDRWFADETYLKVADRWVYLYRAIDQFGQLIDVLVAEKRDLAATGRFFTRALKHGSRPTEVSTDRAPAYPRALDDLVPAACHVMQKYANNAIESDHGRLKSRLRPMRGLKRLHCARVISAGHAFVQNIRRSHYELGTEEVANLRVMTAFTELALAIRLTRSTTSPAPASRNATAPDGLPCGSTGVAYWVSSADLSALKPDAAVEGPHGRPGREDPGPYPVSGAHQPRHHRHGLRLLLR
jgi:transposase, IS6 family